MWGRFESKFSKSIFKLNLVIDGQSVCCEIAFMWLSLDITGEESTLVINYLVSLGNKPLAKPAFTKKYDAIWLHWASMS